MELSSHILPGVASFPPLPALFLSISAGREFGALLQLAQGLNPASALRDYSGSTKGLNQVQPRAGQQPYTLNYFSGPAILFPDSHVLFSNDWPMP